MSIRGAHAVITELRPWRHFIEHSAQSLRRRLVHADCRDSAARRQASVLPLQSNLAVLPTTLRGMTASGENFESAYRDRAKGIGRIS